jgi:ankyrin repeat protein
MNLNWFYEHAKSDLDEKITPLTQAAYLGRREIVEILLDSYQNLDLNLATKDNGYTPISAACMAGNFEIVNLFAENGADVNKVDNMQQSPLIYCFSRLNQDENFFENKALALKMADVLLSYGADIDQLSMGRSILMNFCRQKYNNLSKIQ